MNIKKFEQSVKKLLKNYGYFVVYTPFFKIYANGYKLDTNSSLTRLFLFWNKEQIAFLYLMDVEKVDIEVEKNE